MSPDIRRVAVAAVLFSFFLLGTFFPEPLWGTHFIHFLPGFWQATILVLASALIFVPINRGGNELSGTNFSNSLKYVFAAGIAILSAFAFHNISFPIDIYGDAYRYLDFFDAKVTEVPQLVYDDLLSVNILPSSGRRSTLHFITLLCYWTGGTHGDVIRWLGTICGSLFVFTWTLFVLKTAYSYWWQIVFTIIGLLSPMMLFFFGHFETYAPTYLLLLLVSIGVVSGFRMKSWKVFLGTLLLNLLAVRFHPVAALLLPICIVGLASCFWSDSVFIRNILKWKGACLFILLPITVCGAIVYFFVLGDHVDLRDTETGTDLETMFLPLFSPPPPLDRYNLLSWNHILDFINVILAMAPAALFLLLGSKKEGQSRPEQVLIGSGLILICLLLFVLNPLLGMPMDWDLFMMITPVFLVFTLISFQQFDKKIIVPAVGFMLLSVPTFLVNFSNDAMSYRLESVGKHMFKTNYQHSNRVLISALSLITDDTELYFNRKEKIENELRPFTNPGNDPAFANLLMDDGFYQLRFSGQLEIARTKLQEAFSFDPNNNDNLLYLMEVNFSLKDFAEASKYADLLVLRSYPTGEQALRIGIHASLENRDYSKSSIYCRDYLKINPQDAFIRNVAERLDAEQNLETIRDLFAN